MKKNLDIILNILAIFIICKKILKNQSVEN